MSQAMIVDVTMNNIQEMVIQNSKQLPVMVSFWSPTDERSKLANTILEKLAAEYAGKFILAKINAGQQLDIVEKFKLPGTPFFKLIRNGDILSEQQGLFSEEEYRKLIESQIEKDPSEELRKEANLAFSQGEIDKAIALLGEAAKVNASNYHIHLDLVMMYLHTGHLDQAKSLLEKLPEEAQQDPKGKELNGVLFFSEAIENADDIQTIQNTLTANPNDSDSLYALSGYLMLNGQAENAIQTLFRLFTADRSYQDGLPQKAIIKAFEMLADKAPDLVKVYRRKFQSLLF